MITGKDLDDLLLVQIYDALTVSVPLTQWMWWYYYKRCCITWPIGLSTVPIMKSIVSWAARKHGSVAVSQRLSVALTLALDLVQHALMSADGDRHADFMTMIGKVIFVPYNVVQLSNIMFCRTIKLCVVLEVVVGSLLS